MLMAFGCCPLVGFVVIHHLVIEFLNWLDKYCLRLWWFLTHFFHIQLAQTHILPSFDMHLEVVYLKFQYLFHTPKIQFSVTCMDTYIQRVNESPHTTYIVECISLLSDVDIVNLKLLLISLNFLVIKFNVMLWWGIGLYVEPNKVSHIVNMRFMVANEKVEQVHICYQYWIELLTW